MGATYGTVTNTLKRMIRSLPVLLVLFGLLQGACSHALSVTVIDDLDYRVSIFPCEGRSIVNDPIYLNPKQRKEIKALSACHVTSADGYLGCLAFTKGDHLIRASELKLEIAEKKCDKIRVQPASSTQ